MRVASPLASCYRALLFTLMAWTAEAGDAADGQSGWSAQLLNQILQADRPSSPAEPAPATGELVLRSYQLKHLHVGEAGRSQHLLAILGRLLPAGSAVNPDGPANTLHVLTTASVHQAVWDYLTAIDVPEAPVVASSGVPEDVKTALVRLSEAADQSPRVAEALRGLKTELSTQLDGIETRHRRDTLRFVFGSAALVLLVVATTAWMLRRKGAAAIEGGHAEPSNALTLAPEQLAAVLTPVHDRMRGDVLGMLNEVAIKLQAQHNEQRKLAQQQEQRLDDARRSLIEERRQFITETGNLVVQAVERVDATTARLEKQQDKVAELVQELQDTVRELDETKDHLRSREIELEQERSKIAALSLLLEDGVSLSAVSNGHALSSRVPGPVNGDAHNGSHPFAPCMIHPQSNPATLNPAEPATPRFQFLPPDHPET